MTDDEIKNAAAAFAKLNKKKIAKDLTRVEKFLPDETPVSVFMAGSPGAGKTEFSNRLIEILREGRKHDVLRIDTDDLRSLIPGYEGGKSSLFQFASSILAEKIHDLAIDNKQSFIFDGTFSDHDRAVANLERSLRKRRYVTVVYVYQSPEIAWKFTKDREKRDGRNITKEIFIERFLGAFDTIGKIAMQYSGRVDVFFVKKDIIKNEVEKIVEIIPENGTVANLVGKVYSKEELEKLL